MTEESTLSVADVARRAGCTAGEVLRAISEGRLLAVRGSGGKIRVAEEAVEQWLKPSG